MSEQDLISGRRGVPLPIDSNPQGVVSQQDQPINRPLIHEGRQRNGQSEIEIENARAKAPKRNIDDEEMKEPQIQNIAQRRTYLTTVQGNRRVLRHRKCNIILLLITIFVTILLFQVLCWVRFVCGSLDNTEIAIPVSIGIIPVTFVNLFVYFLTYNSIYFGKKRIVNCMKWTIFVYSLILILLGIAIVIFSIIIKSSDKLDSWNRLSNISRQDFYNNNIENMFEIYQTNMILAGAFCLLIGLLVFLQFFLMCYYSGVLMADWVPPLQSRLIDVKPIVKKVRREKTEEPFGKRQKQVLIKIYKKKQYKEVRDLLGIRDPVEEENERLEQEQMKAVMEKAGEEKKNKKPKEEKGRNNRRNQESPQGEIQLSEGVQDS